MNRIIFFFLTITTFFSCQSSQEPQKERPNILFIAIDDLRPEIGAYGARHMITPNLDKLAASGRLFTNHFVQVPTCGASRYALLRGRRPRNASHTRNYVFRDIMPKEKGSAPESFGAHFKHNGYYTASIGKISHHPDGLLYTYEGKGDGSLEMPNSWNEVWGPIGKWQTSWNAFFGYSDGSNRNMKRGHYAPFESAAVPDTALPDGLIAEKAIETLQQVKDTSFLLAVGFFKPHLPFTAPQRYWDLYDPDQISISPNPTAPVGVNSTSIPNSGEMFGNYYHETKGGSGIQISDSAARKLRHAYYAAVSYVDAQVGKVVDELERLDLAKNTIIVVWGDHGWHLGDHSLWGKHSTFERSLHSAFILKAPQIKAVGTPAHAIVETVDIYPTLTELCGLEKPQNIDGQSLVPFLNDPNYIGKNIAFGFWRGRQTIRTETHRLVAYEDEREEIRFELFDHRNDPLETKNVYKEHPEITQKLYEEIQALPYEK